MKRVSSFVITCGLCLLYVSAAYSNSLYLSIAASMTDVFQEIVAEYSRSHQGIKVLTNFASSGALAKQIAQGAPADLYVSANPKWMQYLIDQEMIAWRSKKVFAYNSLVFLGRPDIAVSRLAQLPNLARIAIGSPQSVPAGQYAKEAMEHAGVYEKLLQDRKLVLAKDVRQALLYADRGEVDGSFVYKTDALLAKNARICFAVPRQLYEKISYPIALTESGAEKKQAKNFLRFVESELVIVILERYGFQTSQ